MRAPYTIEQIEDILGAAEPKVAPEIAEARAAEIRARLDDGDVTAIWRHAADVNQLIADVDAGIELNPAIFRLAMAARRDGHSPETILAHLQMLLDRSAAQASRPERAEQLARQLPGIVRRACDDAGVPSSAVPYAPAAEEFAPEVAGEPEAAEPDAHQRMYGDTVWNEETEQFVVLSARLPLGAKQFSARHPHVGPPTDSRRSAASVFLAEPSTDDPIAPGRRKTSRRFTYRPGGPVFTRGEDGERELNLWRPSPLVLAIAASDEDVRPWLLVVQHVCGEHTGRVILFLAHLLQCPGVKINHALLIKSIQGTGKSTIFTPVIEALGRHNCNIIGPAQIASEFNDWLIGRQLIIVEEMQHFEQKSTMNTIKSYLVGNPSTILVNPKGKAAYAVPNNAAYIFLSNLDVPIRMEASDRRIDVIDSDAPPLPRELADAVHAFYAAGGAAKVARWLLGRDLSGFDATGPAPMTDGKRALLEAAKDPRDAWLDEELASPDCPALVAGEAVRRRMLRELGLKETACTPQRMTLMLRNRGLRLPYPEKLRITARPAGFDASIGSARIYSVRDHAAFAALVQSEGPAALLKAFVKLSDEARAATEAADLALFAEKAPPQ
jgi:Family of unknown function (DUF5906)